MCEIDIVEKLKDAPVGTELYCTILGKVKLVHVDLSRKDYPIKVESSRGDCTNDEILTRYGKLYMGQPDSECILFPSKENRDWSKFDITPMDTPCMVNNSNDVNGWMLRYYARNGRLFDSQLTSDKIPSTSVDSPQFSSRWKYVVPVSKFDFTNLAANFERTIV